MKRLIHAFKRSFTPENPVGSYSSETKMVSWPPIGFDTIFGSGRLSPKTPTQWFHQCFAAVSSDGGSYTRAGDSLIITSSTGTITTSQPYIVDNSYSSNIFV